MMVIVLSVAMEVTVVLLRWVAPETEELAAPLLLVPVLLVKTVS